MLFIKNRKNKKERTPEEKVRRGIFALAVLGVLFLMALLMPLPSKDDIRHDPETGIVTELDKQLDSVLNAAGFKEFKDIEKQGLEYIEFFPQSELEDTIQILEARIQYLEGKLKGANKSTRERYEKTAKDLQDFQEQHEAFLADSTNLKKVSCRRIFFTVSDTVRMTCFQNIDEGKEHSYLTNIITME